MSRVNKNSRTVCQYDANGNFIGEYASITDASKASGFSTSVISTALIIDTHRTKDMYFIGSRDESMLKDAMSAYEGKVRKRMERTKAAEARSVKNTHTACKADKCEKKIQSKEERCGDYIFIETRTFSDNDCCIRCGLYDEKECFPCDAASGRTDGKKGYWRLCRKMKL